jgi:hypothetical protein
VVGAGHKGVGPDVAAHFPEPASPGSWSRGSPGTRQEAQCLGAVAKPSGERVHSGSETLLSLTGPIFLATPDADCCHAIYHTHYALFESAQGFRMFLFESAQGFRIFFFFCPQPQRSCPARGESPYSTQSPLPPFSQYVCVCLSLSLPRPPARTKKDLA